ncbi:phosphoribosylaminoimidazole carboxylase [Methylomonas koyamae]|uniref:Phosphoribosylaminoimidazole carboxylase n=1 Tax=Methylomonas koyamae TaxID=702114 RepID=A0A291ILN5_9GAMM|nr:cupin domain-containing protein [Methylomonas koyamae]ATG91116.1 phosphoribosylaminoimidazole carboxylase [Methylomonas koyamae]OAI29366.1 phosphoribosylaminoimidazole carboxylase [Methylomonas koyamae]
MRISSSSIFTGIPVQLPIELCQTLFAAPNLRIERIVSRGHITPKDAWYDQAWDEWVLVLQGAARLSFKTAAALEMVAGDYVMIPAHCLHRVDWTSPDQDTVWLAIHIGDSAANGV